MNCIATRGCTSRATSREAHVRRVEWTGRSQTPAFRHRGTQIGIGRAAALIRMPDGQSIALLNARMLEHSQESDEQYEGRLSFFNVRGMVPRPIVVQLEHVDRDCTRRTTEFSGSVARFMSDEIDRLVVTCLALTAYRWCVNVPSRSAPATISRPGGSSVT